MARLFEEPSGHAQVWEGPQALRHGDSPIRDPCAGCCSVWASVSKSFALYHPGPLWVQGASLKELLFFFDGVCVVVPEWAVDLAFPNPETSEPLREMGMLKVFTPRQLLDDSGRQSIATTVSDIVDSGAVDTFEVANWPQHLSLRSIQRRVGHSEADLQAVLEAAFRRDGIVFDNIAYAGIRVVRDDARDVWDLLQGHNLARLTTEGIIAMSPRLSSVLRATALPHFIEGGARAGFLLHPVTDQLSAFRNLHSQLAHIGIPPSVAQICLADLDVFAPDLSDVPLERVLAFREEHRAQLDAYMVSVRSLAAALTSGSESEHSLILQERAHEVVISAGRIRHELRKVEWLHTSGLLLSLIAGGDAYSRHDLASAGVAFGGLVVTTLADRPPAGAVSLSYVVNAARIQ